MGLDPYDCFDLFHDTFFDGGTPPQFCSSCGGSWKRGQGVLEYDFERGLTLAEIAAEYDKLEEGDTLVVRRFKAGDYIRRFGTRGETEPRCDHCTYGPDGHNLSAYHPPSIERSLDVPASPRDPEARTVPRIDVDEAIREGLKPSEQMERMRRKPLDYNSGGAYDG